MFQSSTPTNSKYIHESPFASRGFHNFDTSAQLPRHRWYYFKEGFSASLVEEAIVSAQENTKKNLRIFEPFSGSGTTPLVSSLLGHSCTAVEVNPFLAFVSSVKTFAGIWERKLFLAQLENIITFSGSEKISQLENFSTFSEKEGLNKWLFNRDVLRKYESIMQSIGQLNSEVRDVFILAAIVSAFECSNAKRDGKGLRYKKDWKKRNYTGEDVIQSFKRHALMMLEDNQNFPIQASNQAKIINADSRNAIVTDQVYEDIDLVVTSPPYLNSFDYTDVYRPELFLGGYVDNNQDLYSLRLNTLRSHVQANWPRQTQVECDLLKPILEKLKNVENLWNKNIPLMVEAYFDDLNSIITNVTPKLRSKGQVWIVVSTSAYGGVHIPVDLILAELAHSAGLTLQGIHRLRDLRTSSQQSVQLKAARHPLRESLIILSKP